MEKKDVPVLGFSVRYISLTPTRADARNRLYRRSHNLPLSHFTPGAIECVILSAAKNLGAPKTAAAKILRCAQDDSVRGVILI